MDKGNIIIILAVFLVMGSLIFAMMITPMPETSTVTPTVTPTETPTVTPTETPTETSTSEMNASEMYRLGLFTMLLIGLTGIYLLVVRQK